MPVLGQKIASDSTTILITNVGTYFLGLLGLRRTCALGSNGILMGNKIERTNVGGLVG